MKRIFACLLVFMLLFFCFGMVACDDGGETNPSFDNPKDGTFGVDFDELLNIED